VNRGKWCRTSGKKYACHQPSKKKSPGRDKNNWTNLQGFPSSGWPDFRRGRFARVGVAETQRETTDRAAETREETIKHRKKKGRHLWRGSRNKKVRTQNKLVKVPRKKKKQTDEGFRNMNCAPNRVVAGKAVKRGYAKGLQTKKRTGKKKQTSGV